MYTEDNSPFTIWFALGYSLNIQDRTVKSFPVLFGDISGLKDFFNFFVFFLIGGIQTKLYNNSRLKSFFRFTTPDAMRSRFA